MTQLSNFNFPCDSCGKCCRNLHLSSELNDLNRGDGVCLHFDEQSNLCSIYQERPDVCRVSVQYKKNYSLQFTWQEFVEINISICKQLKGR